MIVGIGTDILKITNIEIAVTNPEDVFIRRTYTANEIEIINSRENPLASFATRFAGKEAVFKSLSISPDSIRSWNDIEILENDHGQPVVFLHGDLKKIAADKNITTILLSLSFEKEYAIAYATALSL
ncbi:MAG: holo-ACP synthase [Suipraeoptans sp.]